MKVKLRVQRFDGKEQRYQEYEVELWRGATVLDALKTIKDEHDGSLAYRASCRSAICGSCAMQINGQGKLACRTQVKKEVKKFGSLVVEPLKGAKVKRDLIVDFEPFWDGIKRFEPWIDAGKPWKLSWKEISSASEAGNCIMCGICTFNCESYRYEKGFLGPAAFAKAYRVIFDPRSKDNEKRVKAALENGLWWCSRSYYCSDLCPKGVKPGEKLFALRGLALKDGHVDSSGARRVLGFSGDIQGGGRLNETTMPLRAQRLGSLRLVPLALKMLLRGKLPSPVQEKIKGLRGLREIYWRAK